MIIISGKDPASVACATFLALFDSPAYRYDHKLARNDLGILTLEPNSANPEIRFDGRAFHAAVGRSRFSVGDPTRLHEEIEHYTAALVSSGELKKAAEHLATNQGSKRCVAAVWDQKFLDTSRSAPCLIYLWFRVEGPRLIVHTHMRANDAFNLLLIDLQILQAIHKHVAAYCELLLGDLVHFVDSLHLYRRDLPAIRERYRYLVKERDATPDLASN